MVAVVFLLTVNGTEARAAPCRTWCAANDAVTVAARGGPAIGSDRVATPLALVVALTLVPPERAKVTVRPGSTEVARFGSVSVADTVALVFCGALVAPV